MAVFHSVKDAVKLFDAGFSGGMHPDKKQVQTELCLGNKDLSKLKEKIKNAEMAMIEAMLELEEAKKSVEYLSHKLRSKQTTKGFDISSSSSSNGVRVVTSELSVAKESLERVAEEEIELCILMESLKLQLQNVKTEHSQLKEDIIETNLAEKLKKEAEDAKIKLLVLEEELKIALLEAEEAKAAEEQARERLNVLSKRRRKVAVESLVLQTDFRSAEIKEGGESSEIEAWRAWRDVTVKKLEMSEKEIEDIKAATQDAMKKDQMGKEAKAIVDAELLKRRCKAKEVKKLKLRSVSKEGCLVKC